MNMFIINDFYAKPKTRGDITNKYLTNHVFFIKNKIKNFNDIAISILEILDSSTKIDNNKK